MESNKEKDLDRAEQFLNEQCDIVFSETRLYFERGERVLDLEEILVNYVDHLEEKGIIKFTANRNGN